MKPARLRNFNVERIAYKTLKYSIILKKAAHLREQPF